MLSGQGLPEIRDLSKAGPLEEGPGFTMLSCSALASGDGVSTPASTPGTPATTMRGIRSAGGRLTTEGEMNRRMTLAV